MNYSHRYYVVDREDGVPDSRVDVGQGDAAAANASDGGQPVQPAEALHGLVQGCAGKGVVGDVTLHCNQRGSGLVRQRGQARFVAIDGNHGRALGHGPERGLPPDARRRAGQRNDLVLQ
tara:strand:+ start:546 stop:902 length:357 start_codon:yes stop_codon:yes gene_type:complete